MGEVDWINAPGITSALMGHMTNPINYRIAHINVRRRHIDLQPQHMLALGKFTVTHALKQIQIFFNGPASMRAVLSRFGSYRECYAWLLRLGNKQRPYPL